MSEKLTLEERQKTLASLRINASQASAQMVKLVGFIEELNRDNIALRRGYAQLKSEVELLKRERVAV